MITKFVFSFILVALTPAAQDLNTSTGPQSATIPPSSRLSSNQTIITNQDVVAMLKSGLSTQIVVAKIKSSNSQCDTSPIALADLKVNGVPDSVILAILESSKPSGGEPPALGDIREAKSACLVNKGRDMKVFNGLTERLEKWGRWKIVSRPEKADLLLVFADDQVYVASMNTATVYSTGSYATGTGMSIPLTSLPRYLVAVDRQSGRQLLTVSCERRMGAGYTAGVLVNRMRKEIEKMEKPKSD